MDTVAKQGPTPAPPPAGQSRMAARMSEARATDARLNRVTTYGRGAFATDEALEKVLLEKGI